MSELQSSADVNVLVAKKLVDWMKSNPALDTQMKLAIASGVGQTTIGRILKSEVSPTLESVTKICAAFGKEVGELISVPSKSSINYDTKAYAKLPEYEKARVEAFIKVVLQQHYS